jgi:hypothetical protein
MLFSNGSRIGRKSYIFLRTYLKKMDDFGAPATLPAVSRKRPRYDDQIVEYRDRASTAANELGALSEGEFDARLENHNAAEDEREFQDFGADHADDMDEERRLYPGPLRRLSRPTAEEREAPMVTITQAHSNPVAGVENVRMTLRNRLGRT